MECQPPRIFPERLHLITFTNKYRLGSRYPAPHFNTMVRLLFGFILCGLGLVTCQKEDLPESNNPYTLRPPDHFPPVLYPLQNNPITKNGFELGKALFEDPLLSIDNSISCSSCHVKAVAFTDPQHILSLGVFDQHGTRNAPMIANLAFQKEFLFDGGISHLDFVPVFAIENKKEMGETMAGVVAKLNQSEKYRQQFQVTFPETDSISSPYILKALSQYMLLLISDNSRFDQYLRGELTLSQEEKKGHQIFVEKCAQCHSGNLFTNQQFMNNGLDSTFTDRGRAIISETEDDAGKFKVPSLRNIDLTAPFMHDGRFQTLEQVLQHYRSGIKYSPTLASELINNDQPGISMTDEEAENLILFLKTLTDYEFISNPIF